MFEDDSDLGLTATASVMLLLVSSVTMAGLTGSAAAAVDSTDRTINKTQVTPGETVRITVQATYDSQTNDARIDDIVAPAVSSDAIQITDNHGATISAYQESTGTISGSWGDVSTAAINYSLTIPADVAPGTTYEFSGEAEDGADDDAVSIMGSDQIEIVAPADGEESDTDGSEPATESDDSTNTADAEEETAADDTEQNGETEENTPGFGIVVALVALVSVGYIIRYR